MFLVKSPKYLLKCLSSLSPCTSKYSTLQSIQMSYATYEDTTADSRQADPLIIIHGLFGSKSNWNSLCKAYRQKTTPQRKIVAADARNHGDSPHTKEHTYPHMAEDIKSLYGQLGIGKAALMGHSMGGRAVMLFALKYPELVDRLIVADMSPVRNSGSLDEIQSIFGIMESIKMPSNMVMSKAKAEVDAQLSESISSRDLRSFLLTNLISNDDGSYSWRVNLQALAHFHEITTFPNIDGAQYNGPVLFVAGGSSDFVERSDLPQIQKLFPNAELQFIEGAGHWLHSEKPTEFLKITLDFLNK